MSEFENVIRTWTHKDWPNVEEDVKKFLRAYDILNEAWGTITNITRREYDGGDSICIEFKYDDDDVLTFPIKDKDSAVLQIIEEDEAWVPEGYFSDLFITMNQVEQCASVIWPEEFESHEMCLTYMKHLDINHAIYKYYPKDPNELKGWKYVVTLSRKDISKLIKDSDKIMDVMFNSICSTDMAPWDIGRSNPDE